MDLAMGQEVLSYIQREICTNLFCWIKQVEENGMFNGEWKRRNGGLEEFISIFTKNEK